MSLRLGIDFQSVRDVEESLRLYGADYLESVYDEGECLHALAHPGSASKYLARRFAAREAIVKLLDADDGLAIWGDILLGDGYTPTSVHLRGAAQKAANGWGIGEILLSVASTRELATAVAVADLKSRRDDVACVPELAPLDIQTVPILRGFRRSPVESLSGN